MQERRRADRRDHVLHEHVEPERAARRRPAGQEGGRSGPDGHAAHQDLARARLARRHRLPDEDRPAAVPRPARLPARRLTAARPASATPATSTPALERGDHEERPRRAAVLSGNRNFEARIHPNIKANFLASPPLVVAYAIAGNVRHRPDDRAARQGQGRPATSTCGDIWPTTEEVNALLQVSRSTPTTFRKHYGELTTEGDLWNKIAGRSGQVYDWPSSRPTSRSRRSSATSRWSRRDSSAIVERARRSASSATRSRPTTSRRPDRSRTTSPAGKYLIENDVHEGRLQQLRRAPRQPRGDDARHVRERAHQEPDGAAGRERHARRRRRDAVPADGRADADLRRGDEVHRTPARRPSSSRGEEYGTGSVARLGGQGHAAARREGGDRAQLRAHPSLQPGRHGRAAAAVQGRRVAPSRSASTATRRSTSSARRRASSRRRT